MPSSSLLTVLLLALLAGCVPFHNQAATAEYDRRVVVANMRVAQLEESLSDADARLAQAEEWIRVRGHEDSEQLEDIEQVNQAVRSVRGEIELLRHDVDGMRQTVDRLQVDQELRLFQADARLKQLESYLGVTPPPPPTAEDLGLVAADSVAGCGEEPDCEDPACQHLEACGGEPAPEPGDCGEEPDCENPACAERAECQEAPDTASGYLDLGIEHMKAGRQGVARAVFEKAMAEFPDDDLVPELRYRVAETWFNESRWQKAAISFQHVLDNHGTSEWASWSMLRQGECFLQLGDQSAARLFYEELGRLYPDSEAAREAKRALRDL